jgi:AMMECR1 domain-containing protein
MTGGVVLKLAKQAAEHYVKHKDSPALPLPLPREVAEQRPCYVTILENPGRHFRGMYGQPFPRQPSLAREIVVNTVAVIQRRVSGSFRPVDLPYLIYSVAVLDPMERITTPAHLNPHLYGLYVCSDRQKSAILLPQRTGVETAEDQVATAIRESGIDVSCEAVTMYRFYVRHYD